MRAFIHLALVLGSLGACSNYNPDLGNAPFKCANAEPKCPENYTCQADTAGMNICMADMGMGTPDGSTDSGDGFQCASDGNFEPNETYQTAYTTDVGAVPMRKFGPLSICPIGDKDTYRIDMPSGMKSLVVLVTWDSGPPLTGAILNAGGSVLMAATGAGNNAVRACASQLPQSTFYAQVAAASSDQNNYKITLSVADNCASP